MSDTGSAIERWMDDAQKCETPSRGTRKRRNEKIVHPSLIKAGEYYNSIDPFWGNFLISCGKGSLPKGFSVKNGILSFGKAAKKRDMPLPDDIESIAEVCINAFRTIGLIYSPMDSQNLHQDEEELNRTLKEIPLEWSKIKSKNIRYNMLWDYVNSHYGHLSKETQERIYTIICTGVEENQITRKQIEFTGSNISNVSGIVITEDGDCYCTGKKNTTSSKPKPPLKPKHYRHFESWCKYQHDLFHIPQKSKSQSKVHSS